MTYTLSFIAIAGFYKKIVLAGKHCFPSKL